MEKKKAFLLQALVLWIAAAATNSGVLLVHGHGEVGGIRGVASTKERNAIVETTAGSTHHHRYLKEDKNNPGGGGGGGGATPVVTPTSPPRTPQPVGPSRQQAFEAGCDVNYNAQCNYCLYRFTTVSRGSASSCQFQGCTSISVDTMNAKVACGRNGNVPVGPAPAPAPIPAPVPSPVPVTPTLPAPVTAPVPAPVPVPVVGPPPGCTIDGMKSGVPCSIVGDTCCADTATACVCGSDNFYVCNPTFTNVCANPSPPVPVPVPVVPQVPVPVPVTPGVPVPTPVGPPPPPGTNDCSGIVSGDQCFGIGDTCCKGRDTKCVCGSDFRYVCNSTDACTADNPIPSPPIPSPPIPSPTPPSSGGGGTGDGLKDIPTTAIENGAFTTLVAALGAADLVSTLSGPGPFTVFAPTDDAFGKLPQALVPCLLKPENKDALTTILTYHVASGSVPSNALSNGQSIPTLQGDTVSVRVSSNGVTINNAANVIIPDVLATNGIIHAIDAVLLPPSVNVGAFLASCSSDNTPPVDTTPSPVPPSQPSGGSGIGSPCDIASDIECRIIAPEAAARAQYFGCNRLKAAIETCPPDAELFSAFLKNTNPNPVFMIATADKSEFFAKSVPAGDTIRFNTRGSDVWEEVVFVTYTSDPLEGGSEIATATVPIACSAGSTWTLGNEIVPGIIVESYASTKNGGGTVDFHTTEVQLEMKYLGLNKGSTPLTVTSGDITSSFGDGPMTSLPTSVPPGQKVLETQVGTVPLVGASGKQFIFEQSIVGNDGGCGASNSFQFTL